MLARSLVWRRGLDLTGHALLLRARRLDFGFPTEAPGHPVDTVACGEGVAGEGTGGDPGRGLRAGLGTSLRDRCGQGVGEGVHPGAASLPSRAAADPGVGRGGHHERHRGTRRVPGGRGDREGHPGVDVGLLADLVLPAGSGRSGRAAGQRPRHQERAGPAEDRQAGQCLAGEDDRAGHAAAQLRPAGRDPPVARLHPDARGPDAGTHPVLAAAGEAAGGLADQGLGRGLHAGHQVGAGHAGGAHRRGTGPEGARRPGPRPDEGQAGRADRGAHRPFRRTITPS